MKTAASVFRMREMGGGLWRGGCLACPRAQARSSGKRSVNGQKKSRLQVEVTVLAEEGGSGDWKEGWQMS